MTDSGATAHCSPSDLSALGQRVGVMAVGCVAALACDPTVVIGTRACGAAQAVRLERPADPHHLEVYFKRAKDATGEITLWQDSTEAVHLTGLATDPTDWGQWYVGNLANDLLPPNQTVYVDDVTISLTQ